MRQLKFRAWDKKEKKWLFGYEYPNLGGFSLIGEVVLMGELSGMPLDKLCDDIDFMQYIGLKDTNDKEIYEGDVCKITTFSSGSLGGHNFVVYYSEKDAMFRFKASGDKPMDNWDLDRHGISSFKIIGNIYEGVKI